ncbi:MAG: hypothetical protein ACKV2Q_21135 [Planctomycetaceae bacterium]
MKFTTFIPTHLNDETVKSIGRKLGQKAMWIEFDFSDNAQVIDCES